jgi:hypothetical protein
VEMAFLNICGVEFLDIQKFIEFMDSNKKGHRLPSNLQLVATISTLKTLDDFISDLLWHGFIIEKKYGKLLYIYKLSHNKKIYYYVFFDETRDIHLFMTIARKTDDIPDTLLEYIKRSGNVSNLWITPKIMKELKDELIKEYNDLNITYFSAKRSPNSEIAAEYRPEVNRGIQYRGDDGRLALDEMEFYYGVLPKILEIRLPTGVSFRIDNKGIITLFKGGFGDIFRIIESLVRKLIRIKYAIEESSYIIHEVGINKQFSHAIQTPWSVKLSSGSKISDIKNFCRELGDVEWDFTLLEHIILEEANQISARIVDNNNNSIFDISTAEDRIDIYPVDQTNIGTYLRFYELLVENIDAQAAVG